MSNDDGEVEQVTRFMKGVARAMERQPVPDAHAVWAEIQLAERQRLAERAQRPMQLAWMFARCWFAFGAALILYSAWPVIGDFFLTMPTYGYVAIAAVVAIVHFGRRSVTALATLQPRRGDLPGLFIL
jgi:hypothetical protein